MYRYLNYITKATMWMKAWVIIFLLSGIFVAKTSAQSYLVSVTGYPGTAGWSIKSFSCSSGSSSGSSMVVSSIPTGSFSITFSPPFGSGYSDCTLSGSISGCSGGGSGIATPCGGSGTSWGISLYTAAIIAIESGTSATGDYCVNQNITLVGTSGFTGSNWQYRVESGGWQNFDSGSGSTVTFGVQDIFGSSYGDYLNKEIYFRYNVACGVTNAVGPYLFSVIPLHADDHSKGEISCHNSGDGSLTVTSYDRAFVSGESLKNLHLYTQPNIDVEYFVKSSPPGVNAINGISPGTYYVLVEGSVVPCSQAPSFYGPITFNNPSQVTFSHTEVIPSCNTATAGTKNNGSITINPDGGTYSNYEYAINGGAYQSAGGDPFTISGLTEGSYSINVRDGNDCESVSQEIIIAQPPDISVSTPAVTSGYNGSDISCVGNSDGQITITASGGTPALMYSRDGTNYQSSNIFDALGAGSYTVTVKDGNGCTKQSEPVSIEAPPAIAATLTPTTTSCNGSSDGEILVTSPAGGTGSLEYSINGTTYQPATLFTGLLANNYTITIRDANLCTTTIGTTVSQPVAIGITSTPTLVTCAGGNDGSVQITASNAVGTPQYSLNGGTFQASNTFTGLSANTYTVTVRDGNNCLGNGNVTINSNPIITGAIAVATPVSCNGSTDGALNLTPGGGVGPYTFLWSTGATSEDITALGADTYSVTITDSENCQQSFNRVLSQPMPVAVTYFTSDFNGSGVRCFGNSDGSINITSTGGNGGYTYQWSNGAVTENISGLSANTYSVTVTDSKNCTGNQSITITQPPQLITTINNTENIACFGGNTGSITLATAGGTTEYEYSINNGASWQSVAMFEVLSATTYTILTRDVNGCSDSDGVTLTSPAELLLVIDDITNTTCAQSNGAAVVSASGGVSSYSYNWFNSGNALIGSGNSIDNLTAGIYRVEVIDQNNCSSQQNITISSSDGPLIAIDNIIPVSCAESMDGVATLSITQGQTPYTILWPDGQTSATATNLSGGDHIVEVTDGTGCLALQTITVPAPQPLVIQLLAQQNPACTGNADGIIEVLAQGGNGDYVYNWSTGETTTLLTNLPAGTYTLTTTDSKNCEVVEEIDLVDPPLFLIDLGEDEKICEGQTIIKQSEVDNATYTWTGPDNFTSNQQQISISQPGVYTLTVINQNGCEASDSFILSFDTNLLKADFLMVSEAFAGDTIMVIDISWPLPTTVTWQFDPAAVVLDQSQDFSLIRFDEPGTYNVSILAQLAQCASSYSQSILILTNPNGRTDGKILSEKLIKELKVYPNPVTDKLSIIIELNEENQAMMELYHLHSNRRELSQTFEGNTLYETNFNINHLQSGLYVIVIKAGNEIKSVKLMKL